MSTDATPAESSPAATSSDSAPISGQSLVESFSSEERDTWEKTGTLPDRVSIVPDAKPASSPAKPVEQAASTEVVTDPPASEAGKPKGDKLRARNAQLDEENKALQEKLRLRHALREELASLDRPKADATPDSSPAAKAQSEWQRFMALPEAPKESDFETYAEFTAAQALFMADKRFEEHQQRARDAGAREQRDAGVRELAETATRRVKEYADAHPGFTDRIDPRLLEVAPVSVLKPGQPIRPSNVLAEEIAKSPATAQLLEHFSTDAGRQDWQRLCRMPPADLLRAFGRLEAQFDSDRAPNPAVPQKHVSSAPSPATVLGTAPADTGDPIEKAVRDKDFERYEREANKRDLASARR